MDGTKGNKFSVKSFYQEMVRRGLESSPTMLNWNSEAPTKRLFCLGSNEENDSYYVHLKRRRWTLENAYFYAKARSRLVITSFFIVVFVIAVGFLLVWSGFSVDSSIQEMLFFSMTTSLGSG